MQKKLVETIILLIVILFCVFYIVKNPDQKLLSFIILAYCWFRFRKKGD